MTSHSKSRKRGGGDLINLLSYSLEFDDLISSVKAKIFILSRRATIFMSLYLVKKNTSNKNEVEGGGGL